MPVNKGTIKKVEDIAGSDQYLTEYHDTKGKIYYQPSHLNRSTDTFVKVCRGCGIWLRRTRKGDGTYGSYHHCTDKVTFGCFKARDKADKAKKRNGHKVDLSKSPISKHGKSAVSNTKRTTKAGSDTQSDSD